MDAKDKTKTPKTEVGDKEAAGAAQLSVAGSSGAGQSHKGPPSSTIRELTKKKDESKDETDAADEENGDFEDTSEGETKEEEEEDRAGLVKALRRMAIRAPKPFDPKRDRKFETWLDRTEYHLMVTKCPDEDRTACLLLLLDSECYEQAKHLGITGAMDFSEAKNKLHDYFAITETAEELR